MNALYAMYVPELTPVPLAALFVAIADANPRQRLCWADRTRAIRMSGGPVDGLTLDLGHVPFVLPGKLRVPFAGRRHRYVLEDAPKLRSVEGAGHMTLEYRYEGSC